MTHLVSHLSERRSFMYDKHVTRSHGLRIYLEQLLQMTTEVRLTCVQHLVPHFAPKEKFWCSGAAARHPRREERAKQLVHSNPQRRSNPPKKRRAASIPDGINEVSEWEDNSQYTDGRPKVLRDSFHVTLIKLTPFDKEAAKGSDTHRGRGQCGRPLWGHKTDS
jgi:hypothetical protein